MRFMGKAVCRFLLLLLPAFSSSFADESLLSPLTGVAEEQAAPGEETANNDHLLTPRDTVTSFVEAMTAVESGDKKQLPVALSTMDLSDVNPIVKEEKGEALAWQLMSLVNYLVPDVQNLPVAVSQEAYTLGTLGAHTLTLSKHAVTTATAAEESKSEAIWLFSKESLNNLEAMLEVLVKREPQTEIHQPLMLNLLDELPATYKETFIGLKAWQWLGLFVFILFGMIADFIFSRLSTQGMRRFVKRANKTAYQGLPDDMLRPFGLMLMAMVWWIGIKNLLLPEWILVILTVAVKFLISLAGVWGAYRLVDLVGAWFQHKAGLTSNKFDDALVPLIRRTLKVFVTVVGLVFIADTLQINIAGLLAGLGLGGLAFALASKDLAQNLLGTVTILIERTFSVGDWITVADVEGTVEDISFRSTRIRTFYDSLITLPNSNMITAHVDNYGERRFRRYTTKLGLAYETPPDKIEAFCEGVREIVRLHPYMRKDNYHVYFNGYAESALEILVYIFWQAPDWATELRERHRFLLDVLRLAHELGVDFAYPTQTVYWKEMQAGGEPIRDTLSKADTYDAARNTARNIVENSLVIGERPAPVVIEREPQSR